LPVICDLWLQLKTEALSLGPRRTDLRSVRFTSADGLEVRPTARTTPGAELREELLAELSRRLPFAYVPRFYEPEYAGDGRLLALNPTRPDVPATIDPSVIDDLDGIPLPAAPIVPYVECVHDRIAIEIMRGCPWQCRFCQSTVIKR